MAVCSHCGVSLSCPTHEDHPVEGVAEQCPLNKMGLIWVEVVDEKGNHVNGSAVQASGGSGVTKSGFAQFDPVPSGRDYTAQIDTVPESHKDTHALPLKKDQTGISVQNGQIKLVTFKLRAIVKPVITIAKKVVAVGGKKQAVVLKADRAFSGKGTLTVESGATKVKLHKGSAEVALAEGKAHFEGLNESGVTLDVEALDFSPLDGVVLKWELSSDTDAVGPAVTDKMTAVKATLDIHNKSDVAWTKEVKTGVGGVVILQNTEKTHRRAKLTVKCEPTDYVGTLVLKGITTGVTLFDAAKDGTEKPLPHEVSVGAGTPAALYVQGKTVSPTKTDTGLKLSIKDLADDVDQAKLTVVDARLDVYLARATPTTEPVAMAAGPKKEPGRLLVKQDAKFKRARGKLVLIKLPKDAPCKLKLKRTGTKVALFPEANEKHIDAEAAVTLPKDVDVGGVTDDKGITFWAEGSDLTSFQEVVFELDVEDVEDACDKAFYSVVDLCAENGTDPAPRLIPVDNKITNATPVQDHKTKIKLVHSLGTATFAWTAPGAKFTLTDATTQTVALTAGATPSDDAEKEELSVVITPDGKPAFPALIHRMGVVEILFEEDSSDTGGYDKYEIIPLTMQDNSTSNFDPPEKYDFMSVKKSSTGKVTVKYKGAVKEDIFFVPVDAAIAKPKKDSPDGASPYTMEVDGQAKDQDETIFEARIESKTGKVVNKLGVVVLKQVDLQAEYFRVHDSTRPATALSRTVTGTQITDYLKKCYGAAIATLTVAEGGLKDLNYDTSPTNDALDLEPGVTSAEEMIIMAGCISTKARIVCVKKLVWSYYLDANALSGATTMTIKNYGSHYLGFIGRGKRYKLGSNAHSQTVTISTIDTSTGVVTFTPALTAALNTADKAALIWPLGGLSGNPAWLQDTTSDQELKECVGHELGHELGGFLDICEKANLMWSSADCQKPRLRHRELERYYPGSGGDKQWTTIPR